MRHVTGRSVRGTATRDQGLVRETLDYVREVAGGDGNVVPPVLEAVRAYATIGEICGILEKAFGVYREVPVL